MPINEHPKPGTILLCDYSSGFKEPEMVKRRPVIVISPKISVRPRLCTVIALSASPPTPQMGYHCRLELDPPLPAPWTGDTWVKGDMVNAVGFHRLDFIRIGKDASGRRMYRYEIVTAEQLRQVLQCLLCAVGLAKLTSHL